MGLDDLAEINPRQDVPVRRDEWSFVQVLLGVLYASCGPQGKLFYDVIEREPVEISVRKVTLNGFGQIAHREDHAVEIGGFHGIYHVLHIGLVTQRHHGFGYRLRYGAQPRPFTADQGNRSHAGSSFPSCGSLALLTVDGPERFECYKRRRISSSARWHIFDGACLPQCLHEAVDVTDKLVHGRAVS